MERRFSGPRGPRDVRLGRGKQVTRGSLTSVIWSNLGTQYRFPFSGRARRGLHRMDQNAAQPLGRCGPCVKATAGAEVSQEIKMVFYGRLEERHDSSDLPLPRRSILEEGGAVDPWPRRARPGRPLGGPAFVARWSLPRPPPSAPQGEHGVGRRGRISIVSPEPTGGTPGDSGQTSLGGWSSGTARLLLRY